MKLTISKGNSKIGNILNVSFPPIVTCAKGIPCAKACYARKAWQMYPNVREAWQGNWDFYRRRGPHEFLDELLRQVSTRRPKGFRWFVAGDIPDQEFVDVVMWGAATVMRKVPFFCATKRHDLAFGRLPENVHVRMSMWPGWKSVPTGENAKLPKAWMQDGTEARIPKGAVECSGRCDECLHCYSSDRRDVVFAKH